MVMIPAPSVAHAAALLPLTAGHAVSGEDSIRHGRPGKACSASQTRWQGHVLLVVAVVLWLVLMDAGLHGGGGTQRGAHALQHSGPDSVRLQDLGRMLLARCTSSCGSQIQQSICHCLLLLILQPKSTLLPLRVGVWTKVNVSLCSFTDGSSALADTKKPFMWNSRNIATMILAFAVRADPQGRVVYAKLLTHATCHNYVQLLHGQ